MAGILKLFCSGRKKQLYDTAETTDPFSVPVLFQGSQTIEFCLLEAAPGGQFENAPWTTVSPGAYGLRIGLYLASTGAQLAFQNSWVATAENTYTGTLGLNTAAIITALTSATSANCIFEISTIDAGGAEETVYQAPVVLKKAYGIASLTIPADVTVATQDWVRSTFVQLEEDDGKKVVLSFGSFAVEIGVNADGTVALNGILL